METFELDKEADRSNTALPVNEIGGAIDGINNPGRSVVQRGLRSGSR